MSLPSGNCRRYSSRQISSGPREDSSHAPVANQAIRHPIRFPNLGKRRPTDATDREAFSPHRRISESPTLTLRWPEPSEHARRALARATHRADSAPRTFCSFASDKPLPKTSPRFTRPHSKESRGSPADHWFSGGKVGRGCFTPTPSHSRPRIISLTWQTASSNVQHAYRAITAGPHRIHRPDAQQAMSLSRLLSDNPSAHRANFAFPGRSAPSKHLYPKHCIAVSWPVWVESRPTGPSIWA